MKKWIICLLGVLAVGSASDAVAAKTEKITASNHYISKDVAGLPEFSALSVSDDIDVVFRQSVAGQSAVNIYGADNAVDRVTVDVRNGVLNVQYDRPVMFRGEKKLTVSVSGPKLMRAAVSRGADLEIKGAFTADMLELEAGGKSEISMESADVKMISVRAEGDSDIDLERVAAGVLRVSVYGKSDADVNGTVTQAILENHGSGDIDAEDLRAQNVQAIVHGSGDIKCFAAQKLDAQANGRGTIEYKGMPSELKKSGSVKKIMPAK